MDGYRTIEKPWGKEEVIEINDKYMVKRLTMKAGNRCSLQYHNEKTETIYVVSGILRIIQGVTQDSLEEGVYGAGDSVTIQPGCIHRMEGIQDAVYLEASTPEFDDVVRLADDYHRSTL